MKIRQLTVSLLLLLLSIPIVSQAQNEIEREISSLRGINELGFTINLETNVTLNEKGEIEVTSIKDAAEQRLSEAGIPLVSDREVKSSADIPFLYMHINTMDAGQGLVPFSISLRFYQPVKLQLNRDRQTSASTWETGMVGIVSYDRMNIIQEAAVNLLGDFVDDFRSVNN
ncbi:MAG: hypothetical protein ACNS64_03645 [Candidatus Halalkalibacterium sp. M3_1C_030]